MNEVREKWEKSRESRSGRYTGEWVDLVSITLKINKFYWTSDISAHAMPHWISQSPSRRPNLCNFNVSAQFACVAKTKFRSQSLNENGKENGFVSGFTCFYEFGGVDTPHVCVVRWKLMNSIFIKRLSHDRSSSVCVWLWVSECLIRAYFIIICFSRLFSSSFLWISRSGRWLFLCSWPDSDRWVR